MYVYRDGIKYKWCPEADSFYEDQKREAEKAFQELCGDRGHYIKGFVLCCVANGPKWLGWDVRGLQDGCQDAWSEHVQAINTREFGSFWNGDCY